MNMLPRFGYLSDHYPFRLCNKGFDNRVGYLPPFPLIVRGEPRVKNSLPDIGDIPIPVVCRVRFRKERFGFLRTRTDAPSSTSARETQEGGNLCC